MTFLCISAILNLLQKCTTSSGMRLTDVTKLPGKDCEIAGAPVPVPCNDTGPDVTIPFSDAKHSKVVPVTGLDGEFSVL